MFQYVLTNTIINYCRVKLLFLTSITRWQFKWRKVFAVVRRRTSSILPINNQPRNIFKTVDVDEEPFYTPSVRIKSVNPAATVRKMKYRWHISFRLSYSTFPKLNKN